MTEYLDMRCGDDVDPFGRDAGPLETLAQDLYHFVITNPFTLLRDPQWGFGLETYLGKPLPSTLAADIESGVRTTFADRISNASCSITPIFGEVDSFRFDLIAEVDGVFLPVAIAMTPAGFRRLT